MKEHLEQPNKFDVPEELRREFEQEMIEIQKASHTAHLEGVLVKDLRPEDFAMWQRIKHYPKLGKITKEEHDRYEADIHASGNPSREKFLGGLINNKLAGIWGFEQLEDFRG